MNSSWLSSWPLRCGLAADSTYPMPWSWLNLTQFYKNWAEMWAVYGSIHESRACRRNWQNSWFLMRSSLIAWMRSEHCSFDGQPWIAASTCASSAWWLTARINSMLLLCCRTLPHERIVWDRIMAFAVSLYVSIWGPVPCMQTIPSCTLELLPLLSLRRQAHRQILPAINSMIWYVTLMDRPHDFRHQVWCKFLANARLILKFRQ